MIAVANMIAVASITAVTSITAMAAVIAAVPAMPAMPAVRLIVPGRRDHSRPSVASLALLALHTIPP